MPEKRSGDMMAMVPVAKKPRGEMVRFFFWRILFSTNTRIFFFYVHSIFRGFKDLIKIMNQNIVTFLCNSDFERRDIYDFFLTPPPLRPPPSQRQRPPH